MERTKNDLAMLQALPLDVKLRKTQNRIREWVEYFGVDGVYVSFSGGKDSTVLLHIVREMYPDIEAVFVNTGLEYPEIQKFVRTFENVTILRPKMRFDEVIKRYGYPIISKSVANCVSGARLGQQSRLNLLDGKAGDGSDRRSKFSKAKYKPLLDVDFKISERCCDVMKKSPCYAFEKRTGKKPILATMTVESMLREEKWVKHGCNAFEAKRPQSAPMSFWTEQDVLRYLKEFNIPYASVYGEIKQGEDGRYYTTGCNRTGCVFCGFGCHLEKEPNRFQRLKETHPKLWSYCMKPWDEGGLGMKEVLDYIGVKYE